MSRCRAPKVFEQRCRVVTLGFTSALHCLAVKFRSLRHWGSIHLALGALRGQRDIRIFFKNEPS